MDVGAATAARAAGRGFSGVTLRLYDKARDERSLYWASSRTGILSLPPVVGRFDDDGRGEYIGDDVHDGRPITCRYVDRGVLPLELILSGG